MSGQYIMKYYSFYALQMRMAYVASFIYSQTPWSLYFHKAPLFLRLKTRLSVKRLLA